MNPSQYPHSTDKGNQDSESVSHLPKMTQRWNGSVLTRICLYPHQHQPLTSLPPCWTKVKTGLPTEVTEGWELKPCISTQDVALSGCLRLPTSFGGSQRGSYPGHKAGHQLPGGHVESLGNSDNQTKAWRWKAGWAQPGCQVETPSVKAALNTGCVPLLQSASTLGYYEE